jgi:hypothetical protein
MGKNKGFVPDASISEGISCEAPVGSTGFFPSGILIGERVEDSVTVVDGVSTANTLYSKTGQGAVELVAL